MGLLKGFGVAINASMRNLSKQHVFNPIAMPLHIRIPENCRIFKAPIPPIPVDPGNVGNRGQQGPVARVAMQSPHNRAASQGFSTIPVRWNPAQSIQ
jgi:hypothetical protein